MVTLKHRKIGVFFIYKLKIKGTKYFYIGATTSIDARKSAHAYDIYNCLYSLRKEVQPIKKVAKFLRVVEHFKKHKKYHKIDYVYIWDRIKLEVLHLVDTPELATSIEDKLLKRYKNNPNCMNILKTSAFYPLKS